MHRATARTIVFLSITIFVDALCNGIILATNSDTCISLLDVNCFRETIHSGRVYQQENFLNEDEIGTLLADMRRLADEGKMIPSGLSNTSRGKNEQGFGKNDRSTCPAPWWIASLQGDRINCEHLNINSSINCDTLNSVSVKIQQLRAQISDILQIETMKQSNFAHECYYSQSKVGASLARHLDEFHEETKGPRGWLQPSRRAISWLIYLSDKDWTEKNGGQLRTFPQLHFIPSYEIKVGAYCDDLQVGWLDISSNRTIPVYLDSWYRSDTTINGISTNCVLYTVEDGSKKLITMPWSSEMMGSFYDFIKRQVLLREAGIFLSPQYSQHFKLVQDRDVWMDGSPPPGSLVEDFVPKRGSIVLFDSVSLPHEVLPVEFGTRSALAGWFHVETQPIPQGFI